MRNGMRNAIFTIMKKELARFFGDKRTAFTTIFLPGILIYVIYSFMGNAITNNFTTESDYKPTIMAVNMPDSLKPLIDKGMFNVYDVSADDIEKTKKQINEQATDLCLVFSVDFDSQIASYDPSSGTAAPNVEIYYNSSNINSQTGYTAVTEMLTAYESMMSNKFDINNSDTKYDLAEDKDVTAQIFSMMLPMLLLIFMFSGCMAVAPESIAGEKERGTIATLLITPVNRAHIAIGKIAALSLIAVLGGASSTIGTVLSLPKLMGGDESGMIKNVYGMAEYSMLGLIIFSTVLLLVALVSIVSAFAKSVKEAQSYVSPFMILTTLVGVLAMFGNGIKEGVLFYIIPLYNSVQCMVGIFSLEIVPLYMAVTVASNLIYAGLGVFLLSKMFSSEKIMFVRG